MKILFLDHDGVIKPYDYDSSIRFFDPECIQILNEIILKTNCEIVVSSDWRLHYDLANLSDIYLDEGIIKKPISITPDYYRVKEFKLKSGLIKKSSLDSIEKIRSVEILRWLDNNSEKFKVSKWCAVDDMVLKLGNFVYCNEYEGLIQTGVMDKIIRILK